MLNNCDSVLLISYYFSPHTAVGAKRFSYLSSFFFNKSITPHILTIKEKYISKKDRSFIPEGIVHRTSVFPNYPFRWNKLNNAFKTISFVDQYIGWFFPGLLKGFFLLKKFKIGTVIVTGPPFSSFLIPYILLFFLKFKLIIDYRDPWILYSEPGIRKKINWFIEKIILKKTDVIIFNTQKAQSGYNKLGLNLEKKSFVIPNGYWNMPEVKAELLEKDKKVILYAGNFYGSRSINHLVQAVTKLASDEVLHSVRFSIHVFGSVPPAEFQKLKSYNIPSGFIVEHNMISYNELFKYLKGADILYISQGKDHEYSVPYKLIDYFSIKKPILAITTRDSATHNILKEVDCGETAFMDEPESIYNALKNILLNLNTYSFKGVENYYFSSIAAKYIDILKNEM